MLSYLCWKGLCAFRQWKDVGRQSGTEGRSVERKVTSYLNKCKAREEFECKQMQRREKILAHPKWFHNQHHRKAACNKLFHRIP